MSEERFQAQLHRLLTARSKAGNLWVWHPPDGMGQWRPADWLFGSAEGWGAVEAKETKSATWNLKDWTPQQRQACGLITAAGGRYWLAICWTGAGLGHIVDGAALLDWMVEHPDTKSLTAWGHNPRFVMFQRDIFNVNWL